MEYTLPDISQRLSSPEWPEEHRFRAGRALRLFGTSGNDGCILKHGLLEELSRELDFVAGNIRQILTGSDRLQSNLAGGEDVLSAPLEYLPRRRKEPDHQDSADDHRKCTVSQGKLPQKWICTNRRLPPNSERQKNKMKEIAIASFTRNGCVWNQKKLCAALKNIAVEGYALKSTGKKREFLRLQRRFLHGQSACFRKWMRILGFIGACGIAGAQYSVRATSKKDRSGGSVYG